MNTPISFAKGAADYSLFLLIDMNAMDKRYLIFNFVIVKDLLGLRGRRRCERKVE